MLLSISIPTYNRRKELETCLASIAAAWRPEFAGKVEVIISSNGSTDGTDDLLKSYKIEGLPIHYYQSATNIGGHEISCES